MGGETSAATRKSNVLVQDHLENTRITMLVKHGCEAPNNVIDAQPLQELQPTARMNCEDGYGPCPILKETSKFFVGDATP